MEKTNIVKHSQKLGEDQEKNFLGYFGEGQVKNFHGYWRRPNKKLSQKIGEDHIKTFIKCWRRPIKKHSRKLGEDLEENIH